MDIIEQKLWYKPRGGTTTVWFDNWTNLFKHPLEIPTFYDSKEIGDLLTSEG